MPVAFIIVVAQSIFGLINAIDLMVLTSDRVKTDFFFTVSVQCLFISFVAYLIAHSMLDYSLTFLVFFLISVHFIAICLWFQSYKVSNTFLFVFS